MACTLTPSTPPIFPSSSVNHPSLPFSSWSVNPLGAGDYGVSRKKYMKNPDRKTVSKLDKLPNIGPAISGDLELIGINHPKY
jgi:hypothetical protein